jgi:hypothetical protein
MQQKNYNYYTYIFSKNITAEFYQQILNKISIFNVYKQFLFEKIKLPFKFNFLYLCKNNNNNNNIFC